MWKFCVVWHHNFHKGMDNYVILIFLLWIFLPCVTSFQPHLHMKYNSLCWYGTPKFVLIDKWLLLIKIMLNQWFLMKNYSSLQSLFFGRHFNLVYWYELSVSQMRADICKLSWLQFCFCININNTWFEYRVVVEQKIVTFPQHSGSTSFS